MTFCRLEDILEFRDFHAAQQIKLPLWKEKQYVCITMALSWNQGLLLGVKYLLKCKDMLTHLVSGSALVQGCLHCIELHSTDIP